MAESAARRLAAYGKEFMKVSRGAALATATVLLGLMFAVTPAAAKAIKYEGPVNLADRPGHPPAPTIKFKVTFAGKTPTQVSPPHERGIYSQCTDGAERYDEGGAQFEFSMKVNKKRRFAYTDTEAGFFRITGVVPRKGPVRGTIQIKYTVTDFNGAYVADCDSGVLNWTANRLN